MGGKFYILLYRAVYVCGKHNEENPGEDRNQAIVDNRAENTERLIIKIQ